MGMGIPAFRGLELGGHHRNLEGLLQHKKKKEAQTIVVIFQSSFYQDGSWEKV